MLIIVIIMLFSLLGKWLSFLSIWIFISIGIVLSYGVVMGRIVLFGFYFILDYVININGLIIY